MFPPRRTFHIYTDGSTRDGIDGSWAAIIVENKGRKNEKITKMLGYAHHTSGERMELLAIIRALEFVQVRRRKTKKKIWCRVITDYSNLRSYFYTGEKRRRCWSNTDLYSKLAQLKDKLGAHFKYVRSRHGGTIEAHYLAKGATKFGRKGELPVDPEGTHPERRELIESCPREELSQTAILTSSRLSIQTVRRE